MLLRTYHGVNVGNHLVWGYFTVLLQELPCGGYVFLDIFAVPRDLVARVIFDFYVVVL